MEVNFSGAQRTEKWRMKLCPETMSHSLQDNPETPVRYRCTQWDREIFCWQVEMSKARWSDELHNVLPHGRINIQSQEWDICRGVSLEEEVVELWSGRVHQSSWAFMFSGGSVMGLKFWGLSAWCIDSHSRWKKKKTLLREDKYGEKVS